VAIRIERRLAGVSQKLICDPGFSNLIRLSFQRANPKTPTESGISFSHSPCGRHGDRRRLYGAAKFVNDQRCERFAFDIFSDDQQWRLLPCMSSGLKDATLHERDPDCSIAA
jgi:hypothetical protein